MASISVCMIVKNEEAILRRCLDCLVPIADEIVVVDTGSTDSTKVIAKEYTPFVFDYEWDDDFAAARNFSLSKAGCDFIYVADADEVIDKENLKRFAQLKEALLGEVEVVEMAYVEKHNYSSTENFTVDYRPKLFRRLRASQFADPLHEALRIDPIVYRSNVEIYHMPTATHTARNLAHFGRLVKNNRPFSSRVEMMYARELMLSGTKDDFLAACPYFEEVQRDVSRAPDALKRAACILAKAASMQKDAEMLLRVAAPELVGTPSCEICCALGDYFLLVGKEQQAADWFGAALSGATPELVASSAGSQPLRGLADCMEIHGNYQKATEYRAQADAWEQENLTHNT